MLSAVSAGVKQLREAIEQCRPLGGQLPDWLVVDEIHRLNKNQQDVLLPAIELGWVRFLGLTSENPSFTVNKAVLSRCLVFQFQPLSVSDLCELIIKATNASGISWENATISYLAQISGGDGRRCLNLVQGCLPHGNGLCKDHIDALVGNDSFLKYDREGDEHYDHISALIKSIRGSHPDAALHYLARMLASGEDPRYIARRLIICASEDIGNASPMALLLATSALSAVQNIGMPEARIPLAQATTYMASAPKSNRSYVAINKAMADLKKRGVPSIPKELKNAPTDLMKEIGNGEGYVYAHDDPEGARRMRYLPENYQGTVYYRPKNAGSEKVLSEYLNKFRPVES